MIVLCYFYYTQSPFFESCLANVGETPGLTNDLCNFDIASSSDTFFLLLLGLSDNALILAPFIGVPLATTNGFADTLLADVARFSRWLFSGISGLICFVIVL